MTNSTSPFLTWLPGLKLTWVMKPDTRDRISTWSIASRRPENSWVSAIDFSSTTAAETGGPPAAADASAALPAASSQPANSEPARPATASAATIGRTSAVNDFMFFIIHPYLYENLY